MSADVQRYPVTDVEGRRVAAVVVARAALRVRADARGRGGAGPGGPPRGARAP